MIIRIDVTIVATVDRRTVLADLTGETGIQIQAGVHVIVGQEAFRRRRRRRTGQTVNVLA